MGVALGFSGPPQVYELSSGNFLGLWGIEDGSYGLDTRPQDTAELISTFTDGVDAVVGLYYATPPFGGTWVGTPEAYTPFGTTFQVDISNGSSQLTDSFWVEWTGGTIGWTGFNGQIGDVASYSMEPIATLAGDPLGSVPPAAVPLPASLPLLLAGLGGVALLRRRT